MLLLLGALLGLLAGLATGGGLRPFMALRLRWPLLIVLALMVKELAVYSPLAGSPVAPWLYTVAMLAVMAWAVWHRDLLRGAVVVAAGIGLNLVVVTANLGHMPVAPGLARRGPRQLVEQGVWGQYIVAGHGTRLDWLGDWIQLPGPLGRIFPQAYSPGDFVVFVGVFLVLFLLTRPHRAAFDQEAVTIP